MNVLSMTNEQIKKLIEIINFASANYPFYTREEQNSSFEVENIHSLILMQIGTQNPKLFKELVD